MKPAEDLSLNWQVATKWAKNMVEKKNIFRSVTRNQSRLSAAFLRMRKLAMMNFILLGGSTGSGGQVNDGSNGFLI